jgi:hypothetical protein
MPLKTPYEQTVEPGDVCTADYRCAVRTWTFNDPVCGNGTYVSSEVLSAVIIKILVSTSDVMRFGKWLPAFQRVKLTGSSETLVRIYQIAWHYSSADSNLNLPCHGSGA